MLVTASKTPQNPRTPGQQVGWGWLKLKDFTQYSVPLSNTQSVNAVPNILFSLILNSE